jgi:hypothetical protein
MNDERPIEKLLRRYAKKRRDDASAPLELHPATRRLLQGEVARQFPKRASAGEGGAATLAQVWRSWRARLIWSLPILIGLGVGVWVLVETNQKSSHELALAQNTPKPTAPASLMENSSKVLESSVPKLSAPTLSLADATPDRKKSEATAASSEHMPEAGLGNELLARRFGSIATAPASPSVTQMEPESSLAPSKVAANEPAEVERASGPRSQLFNVAAAPAEGRSKVGGETVQKPGSEFSAPSQTAPLANLGTPSSYGTKADRTLAPASAPTESVANVEIYNDKLEPSAAGSSGQIQAYSQAFANRAPVVSYTKAAKADSTLPVLARFEVRQTGDELRVIDSDGSTYIGETKMPAARQSVTVAAEKNGAEQLTLKNLDQVAHGRLAATPLPEQQEAQSFACRVAGTNRTLNQQVIFTWNFVPLTNELAAAQVKVPAGGGNVSNQTAPAQQFPLLLNNSAINGRAQLGSDKEIEINAVPVTR